MFSANIESEGERKAPPLAVSDWINSEPIDLGRLAGQIVLLHAFQMLCPGCVIHSLPQTARIQRFFPNLRIIGLHTVFEHHAANSRETLFAFLEEFGYSFPVAIDAPDPAGPLPRTMAAYGLRGTPSLILIDGSGQIRAHYFGAVEDMVVGAEIGKLIGS